MKKMKSRLKTGVHVRRWLFVFVLMFNFLGGNNFVYGVGEPRLTMKFTDESLLNVLKYIKQHTVYDFLCNDNEIKDLPKITKAFENATIEEVLQYCLKGTGFNYKISHNVIVVSRKKNEDDGKKDVIIKGRVTDLNGGPLPGATIVVKGSVLGVSTDANGFFTLKLPSTERVVLVASFMGMKSQEILVTDFNKKIVVRLEEDKKVVDEVVVTGYGNVSKGNYTGASTTVYGKDIMMAGVSSIDQMLQGIIPGMLVWNTTGQVGASSKIRVRGTSTLLGSQEPVWVVDGVIQRDPQPFNSDDNMKFSVDADDIKQLAGNAISWLNPNDIETITVLKDASATAIYGSKAANGVIVITTKKAMIGKISVNYTGDYSIGQAPRYGLYDLMNSEEHMQFSREIYEERRKYPNSSSILPIGYHGLLQKLLDKTITLAEMDREYQKMTKQNTDWFDLLFRNSFSHSHLIGIGGGTEKIQNRTSFGVTQEKGEAKGNSMMMFTATSNTTVNLAENLRVNMLLKGSVRDVKGFAYGVDPFGYAYNTSRVLPAYNEDGSYYYHDKMGEYSHVIDGKYVYNYNVLNELANTGSKNSTRTWGATVDLQWRVLPGLEYQGLVSYGSSSSDSKQHATERSFHITQLRGYEFGTVQANSKEMKSSPLPMGGLLETGLTNMTTITVRNSLVYDHLFGEKHRMTLQVGVETNTVKMKGESSARYGYLPDRGESFATPPATYLEYGSYDIDNIEIVRGDQSVVNRVENELSEYASAVYTYDGRYVVNFSGRVDASNRFGQDKNKRFEPTWSVGGKWRVANEHFLMGLWWLGNLDIYASYGYQGNAVTSVSPYLIAYDQYMELYKSYGLKIKSLPYPNLGWEKTKTYNLGVDASFLRGRLNFTFNYFKKISDVLSSRGIPYENGVANGVVSGSEVENQGYDFVINVIPVRLKDFTWQLSLNTSVTRNSVTKNERLNTLYNYLDGSGVVEGRPFSTFYSYEFDKLDASNGEPCFKNMDMEDAESPIDLLVKSGKFIPDFSGGLNTMVKYKRLSLYALFTVQWGGHRRLPNLYPATSDYAGLPRPEQNVSRKLMNRWKKAGDESYTNIPSLPGLGDEQIKLPATSTSSSYPENRYVMYNQSNIRVANTDMIRCRSISLSYDFNENLIKCLGMQRLSVKASMTNPFMWVSDRKWDGLDPETGNWPARRVTSLSLQVMF